MHTTESSLFSKFINITYWAAVVTDTGVPANTGISNVVLDAEANIPALPGNLGLTPSNIEDRDLHATWWVSQQPYTEEEVSQLLIESASNATTAFGFTSPAGKKMSIAALDSHTPYLMTVPKEDIKNWFYKNLTALQGQRDTWYTGSAWESEDSAAIWNYTLYQVVPGILR